MGRYVERWRRDPDHSPHLLIGVTGSPRDRLIIGAVNINQERWCLARPDRGLFPIPTAGPNDLDAFELRGRRISRDANLKFGALASQFFIILNRSGRVIGGAERPSS